MNKIIKQSNAEEMENLGFPIFKSSVDFYGTPIYKYDFFDLLKFIPVGSKIMEYFNEIVIKKGISFIYNIDNVAEFLIKHYKSNPELFEFYINVKISDIKTLSVRACKVLNYYELTYLSEISQFTKRELLKFRNCGVKTVKELEDVLNCYGLILKQ